MSAGRVAVRSAINTMLIIGDWNKLERSIGEQRTVDSTFRCIDAHPK